MPARSAPYGTELLARRSEARREPTATGSATSQAGSGFITVLPISQSGRPPPTQAAASRYFVPKHAPDLPCLLEGLSSTAQKRMAAEVALVTGQARTFCATAKASRATP